MDYISKYSFWLEDNYFDKKTKEELKLLKNNDDEIKDRFFKELEFGTAGVRAVMGAGTNRINIYTVRKLTQGFANFLNEKYDKVKKEICIAYDCRNNSKEFAVQTALVLNANGIKTYIFEDFKQTPLLAYAIRFLNCIGGVVITASHNTYEYNGYKVYGDDGAQISYPDDKNLSDHINKLKSIKEIKILDLEESINLGLYNIVDPKVKNQYINTIYNQTINLKDLEKETNKLKIVYTPLHGTGGLIIKKVFDKANFNNIFMVEEQLKPDGKFPTVRYPNPESKEAFKLAINLAEKVDADIIFANDPDADRVGVGVKDKNGNYKILTGNMIATIMLDYILNNLTKVSNKDDNIMVISSIVSSDITKKMAEYNNIKYEEVLTGFKYIGKKITEFQKNKNCKCIFAYEESYGYLVGGYSREKDGVLSALFLSEICLYYKLRNINLFDVLENIYKKYGYYIEKVEFINIDGIKGLEKIDLLMNFMRENIWQEIGNIRITELRDFKNLKSKNFITGETYNLNFPKSNVLYYKLEDDSWFCIRPSGTEPKLKIYFGSNGKCLEEVENRLNKIISNVLNKINRLDI